MSTGDFLWVWVVDAAVGCGAVTVDIEVASVLFPVWMVLEAQSQVLVTVTRLLVTLGLIELSADNLSVILDPVVIVVHVGAAALVEELLVTTVMGVTAPVHLIHGVAASPQPAVAAVAHKRQDGVSVCDGFHHGLQVEQAAVGGSHNTAGQDCDGEEFLHTQAGPGGFRRRGPESWVLLPHGAFNQHLLPEPFGVGPCPICHVLDFVRPAT